MSWSADCYRQSFVDGKDFERRESRAWLVSWTLMSLILIACALGAFGDGVLSRTEAAAADGLRIEYERVVRFGNGTRVRIFPPSGTSGPLRLTIDRPLLDAFHVMQVVPAPESSQLLGDGVEFSFGRDAAATAPIVFDLESFTRGSVRGTIRSGGSAISIRLFILP